MARGGGGFRPPPRLDSRLLQWSSSKGEDTHRGDDFSSSSLGPSIEVRIGGESSSQWRRVCNLVGKFFGSTHDYLQGFLFLPVEDTKSYIFYLQTKLKFSFIWKILERECISGLL
jgi:hypothetical protein